MYLEVYVDVIFTINLLIDIVLLKLLERIVRQKTKVYRILLGGVIGGISGCVMSLCPGMNGVIRFLLLYIVTGYLMIRVTFPQTNIRNYLKVLFILCMLTYSLGGLLNSLYYYTNVGYYLYLISSGTIFGYSTRKLLPIIPVAVGSMVGLLYILSYMKHQVLLYHDVELRYDNKSICLRGLIDTGNGLKDPISRKPVSVVCYEEAREIFPEFLNQFVENYYREGEVMMDLDGMNPYHIFRWIPYHSIGMEKGILLGVVIPEMVIRPSTATMKEETIHKKVVIGLYQGNLSNRRDYQVILHKDLL